MYQYQQIPIWQRCYYLHDELLWELNNTTNFNIQYIDSSFTLSENINFPIILTLKAYNSYQNKVLEYHLLDSTSLIKNRISDMGSWVDSEITTFGISNKINQNTIDQIIIPEFFILYQNYPNPFNGLTRITFDLLEDAYVSLYVTDAKGRVHDKFLDYEYISSGKYNYNWNGENKSTGIYFFTIRVEVNDHPPTVLSRKMIYLK